MYIQLDIIGIISFKVLGQKFELKKMNKKAK